MSSKHIKLLTNNEQYSKWLISLIGFIVRDARAVNVGFFKKLFFINAGFIILVCDSWQREDD